MATTIKKEEIMTTEKVETKKKNTDYSASAVNLTNPTELGVGLCALKVCQEQLAVVQAKIEDSIPDELKAQRDLYAKQITDLNADLRKAVDDLGSYQNLEDGLYAVKQSVKSKSYNAQPFESSYPEFAQAVIIKSIDGDKLKALQKGGLVADDARLESLFILSVKESFKYIIKV